MTPFRNWRTCILEDTTLTTPGMTYFSRGRVHSGEFLQAIEHAGHYSFFYLRFGKHGGVNVLTSLLFSCNMQMSICD